MSHIGMYVRRERGPGVRSSKWHRVESEIEVDVVTRCGRRMTQQISDGKALQFLVDAVDDLCFFC